MEPRRRAQGVYTLSPEEKIMWKALQGALAAGAVAAALAAHAGGTPDAQGVAPPTRIPDPPAQAAGPAGQNVNIASVPREVRRAVVADAAKRFKVAESAVVLGKAEQVTWNDGSLGCAQRGQMYTQQLVSGYRIVAITSAGQMVYHTDSHGYAVTCGGNAVSDAVQPPARTPPDR
jgi:hypothetical protein